MSHNCVFSICQDVQGFIWLGTINGLNQFDGQTFKNFYNNPDNNQSLTNNTIRHIFCTREGDICVSTASGFDIYENRTGKFTIYNKVSDRSAGLTENSCYAATEDKNGKIWIGTWYNILHCLDRKTNQISHYHITEKGAETIYSLYADQKDNIWVGTRGAGLFKFDQKSKTFKQFKSYLDNKQLAGNTIHQIFQDSKKRFFIVHTNGLHLFNPETGSFLRLHVATENGVDPITNKVVYSISEDKYHLLWVGTENGLVVINPELTKCKVISESDKNANGLKNASVVTTFIDKSNNVWISTQEGIYIYNQYINQFNFVDIAPLKMKNIASYSQTRLIEGKNNEIWVALDEGYNKFNPVTGSVSSVSNKDITTSFPFEIAARDNQKNYFLPALNFDGIFFKGNNAPLKHLTHDPRNPGSISGNYVFKTFRDSRGHIWSLTNDNGLSRYNPISGSFINYYHNPDDSTTLPNNWLFDILEDSRHDIWIATWSGICKFLPEKNCFRRYLKNNNVQVFSIIEAKEGYFWLGSSNGLIKFDPVKGSVIHNFTTCDGLAENLVHGVLIDSDNNLWLGSTKGISKFNPVTKKIIHYGVVDGLQDREFLRCAFLKASDGTMYFGGINGINYFHPDKIHTDPNLPPVIITDFKIFNNPLWKYKDVKMSSDISFAKEITLSYKYNSINIGYAALNYVNPQKCKYKYMLEGFDKTWNNVDNQRTAIYTNLSHGVYCFKVMASNNQGMWNPVPTRLRIIINPPFWLTWWFKTLVVLLVISGLYIGFRIKTYLMHQKQLKLEALVKERTKELKERNKRIEEQSEELKTFAENLQSINELLVEKQQMIENQKNSLVVTNQQLVSLNSTKDKFFSIIAHDLRNPFHVVLGFTEILLSNYPSLPKEKVLSFLEMIYSATKNGNYLLENLLQWSRSQTGHIKFQPGRFSLLPVVEDTLKLFDSDRSLKKINVNVHIKDSLEVFADENMIRTIIRNLVSNAIKFTYEKGQITIRSEQRDSLVEISVQDNGVGIPEDVQKLLFKVESNQSTKGTAQEPGTGLGLILCREFVEKHQGKIWIESKQGKGTKFIFTLPYKTETQVVREGGDA